MAFPFNASGDDYRIIDFNYPQDVSEEALADLVPFEVKRIYYIFDTTPGTVRGNHAQRRRDYPCYVDLLYRIPARRSSVRRQAYDRNLCNSARPG